MFIAVLFIIVKSWKEPRCPSTEEWTQKTWHIYTMEYYAAIKNNVFMKFLDKRMDLENIILNEVTQSKKMLYFLISLHDIRHSLCKSPDPKLPYFLVF